MQWLNLRSFPAALGFGEDLIMNMTPWNLPHGQWSPWCFHLEMPRKKSRGTKSRGVICFLSADNSRNFYQLSISQFEIIAV